MASKLYELTELERQKVMQQNTERGFVYMSIIDRFVVPGQSVVKKHKKYSLLVDGKVFRVKRVL